MQQGNTVMVTGGAGYIGSHTAYALIENGWNVIVVDDLSTGLKELVPQEATFYHCNISDYQAIDNIIQRHNIMAIMHFAGSIVVPESVVQPLKYYQNNTSNSISLIRVAQKNALKAFVFSSTAAVYGHCESMPITEDAPKNPMNPYGMSKLMTEHILQNNWAANRHQAMPYGILRYFNVAGADAQGRSGQYSKQSTHLIKIIAEAVTGKRDGLSIYGQDYNTPDGTCVRDYIHVSDLADAHVLTLEHLLESQKPLIANCGYGKGISVKEVVGVAQELYGTIKLHIKMAERRAGDSAELVADNTAIREMLGWEPNHQSLASMIKSAVAWEEIMQKSKLAA